MGGGKNNDGDDICEAGYYARMDDMTKYIVKRLLYVIPTFFICTFLTFMILALTPGDPVAQLVGPTATEEEIQMKREELGLNDSLIPRYAKYVTNMFRGDLGESWINGTDIFSELSVRLPNTLKLTVYSLCLTVIVGIPLGVIAAVYQNSIVDKLTLVAALLFISIPAFFLALIAQLLFSYYWRLLPTTGADTFAHFIMPTVILSASQIASQVRMTRSSMLDVIQQDYIRTATAKGASKTRVIMYHALRNGLLPVITGIGNSMAHLVSGAAIIEMIFAIPGLGAMLVNGVRSKDVPMVMGPIIFTTLFVCIINKIVDLMYAFIDTRVKLRYMKK